MPRKRNVTLESVVERANSFFRNSAPDLVAERRTMQSFITDVLLGADCYRGFRYLRQEDMPQPDWKPGIIFDETDARNHIYPDATRVCFH